MADPILDEAQIVQLLSCPIKAETIHALQGGAVQALCDLYDRKVTRDEFTSKAAACIGLYGQCSKLWILDNIRQVYESNDLDKARFDAAVSGLSDVIRAQAEVVIEIVKRLQQCPTSQDRVH
jgi:hypothetical protein